jgi:hypothetical protein
MEGQAQIERGEASIMQNRGLQGLDHGRCPARRPFVPGLCPVCARSYGAAFLWLCPLCPLCPVLQGRYVYTRGRHACMQEGPGRARSASAGGKQGRCSGQGEALRPVPRPWGISCSLRPLTTALAPSEGPAAAAELAGTLWALAARARAAGLSG